MKARAKENKQGRIFLVKIVLCMVAALFMAASVTGVSAGEAETAEIVSIDTNRILEKHPAFLSAQQAFRGEMQQMEQQLQEMGEEEQAMAQQMMQQQLQERGQQLQREAMEDVRVDIEKIAREKGYKYVVDVTALVVGGKDITEEVLEEMEAVEVENDE